MTQSDGQAEAGGVGDSWWQDVYWLALHSRNICYIATEGGGLERDGSPLQTQGRASLLHVVEH